MGLRSAPGGSGTSLRRGVVAVATALVLCVVMAGVVANQASAAPGCRVDYAVNQWNTGFTANITLTNVGDPVTSWQLGWTFAGNQQITQSWSSSYTQTGQQVMLANAAWNGSLGTNASTTMGFNANYSGTNATPSQFTLNGAVCTGQPDPTSTPTVTPTTPTSTPTTPAPGNRLNNPYQGARPYVNPEWSVQAAAESGGSRISNQPTGVWLDRIAAINGVNGGMGVAAHLDRAVSQGATLVQFVIYDLPGRDCSALASNGELGPTEIDRYKTQYIDPIAAILARPAYANLRIVLIVEIDSLPNLVTNTGSSAGATAMCNTMQQNGNYQAGIAYALQKFGAIPNVYNYLDAGHHAWLGWDTNFAPTANLMAQTARQSGNINNVHGFITNTANYSALQEPYFTINSTVNGTSIRQSSWVDWNQYVDELSFAQGFRNQLVSSGFDSNIGMLIDTSRNGWGGSARPTGPGPMTDVNAFVNGGRIDRRIHAGNWCNQSGAGLGERPRSAPASGIDAYVWIKPPGESDGSSTAIANDEGKGFDRMCDPTYTGNARNGNSMSGALPNAPLSGHWFSAQFQQLMQNANPAL
ncbi:glycoside hydrolase family 6 protein [Flindersiella endophytica]